MSIPYNRVLRHCGDAKNNATQKDSTILSYDFSEESLQKFYLQGKWVEFLRQLDRDWHWYCHLTFPAQAVETSAQRSFGIWIHDLNRKEFGHHYWKHPGKGITWVRGSEYQERGDIHFHAAIGTCHLETEIGRKRWAKITRGNAKIELYDAEKKGIEYIVKHCKPGNGNIEVSKTMRNMLPHYGLDVA